MCDSFLKLGLSEIDFYGDLVYKRRKIVGRNNFSAQEDNYSVQRDWIQLGYYACWLLSQLRLTNLIPSLIAHWRVGLQNIRRLLLKNLSQW